MWNCYIWLVIILYLTKVRTLYSVITLHLTLNFMRWMALREHQLMNMDFIWYEQVPTDMNFQIAPLKTFLPVLLLSRFPLTQPIKFSSSFKGVSASWYIKADKVVLCACCIFVSCCRIQLQTNYVMWLVWTEGMQCCMTKLWCSIVHATTHCLQLDLKPKLVVASTLNLLSVSLWHSSWYARP